MEIKNWQINKMAAEAVGYCLDINYGLSGKSCLSCHMLKPHYPPDFVNDQNAAEMLVNHTLRTMEVPKLGGMFEELNSSYKRSHSDKPFTTLQIIEDALSATAKMKTLVSLVTLGQISIEDARESLK